MIEEHIATWQNDHPLYAKEDLQLNIYQIRIIYQIQIKAFENIHMGM